MFLIVPISDISISTKSPSFSHAGGFMNAATPLGVPVMIKVPGRSVVPRLRCLMIAGMSKIKSSVLVICLCSPLTFVLSVRAFGSGITEVETRTGPIGANLSNDLAYPCWFPERSGLCQYLDDTSFPTVYPRIYGVGSSFSPRFLQSFPIMTESSP